MRNKEKWKSSKYIYEKGKFIASRDSTEVGTGSRLISSLIANLYEINLRKHATGQLLDLGCGKVPLYRMYRDYVTDNICVDWGNSLHKNEHLDYELDLAKKLPFVDSEFDTIILSDVLEHIPVPENLWKEIARILTPDGKIMMNVPFYYWLHEQPYDYYRYTEFALRRFVETSGLRLVQLDPVGGAPEVMADIFAKNIVRLPKLGRPLALLAQWFTLGLIRTQFGKKLSETTSRSFPLGYFMIAEKPH